MQNILRIVRMTAICGALALLAPSGRAEDAAQREAAIVKAIEAVGGKVRFNAKAEGKPVVGVDLVSDGMADDALVAKLQGLPKLQSVRLRGRGVTDKSMETLAKLPELREITFFGTSVTGSGLSHLKELKKLRKLELASSQIKAKNLAALKDFGDLESLNLWAALDLKDADLACLTPLKNLRELNLMGTNIGDEGMKTVVKLPQLQSLIMVATPLTDAGLKTLKDAKLLRFVNVIGARKVTGAGIADFKKARPKVFVGSNQK